MELKKKEKDKKFNSKNYNSTICINYYPNRKRKINISEKKFLSMKNIKFDKDNYHKVWYMISAFIVLFSFTYKKI